MPEISTGHHLQQGTKVSYHKAFVRQPSPAMQMVTFQAALVQVLLAQVYDVWDRWLQKRVDELIRQNIQINPGFPSWAVRFRGNLIIHSSYIHDENCRTTPISFALKQQFVEWHTDSQDIKLEKQKVQNSIASIMSSLKNPDSWKECLHPSLLSTLEENLVTAPVAFSTEPDSPAVLAQVKALQSPYQAIIGQRYMRALLVCPS